MRLTQIRLSGFKSFVDPTQLAVSRQLVGIVGPNGCGKSNVIDAVRWVLGESKASELRGESMQDVIFNGSASRKPAGRASVELLFDNSQGRLVGPWGRFGELSVKRVLTRDGQSSYSINGQPVRRRDVYDLFMGTGLGPRAYAIIGQGMITRVIESRPEELRVFLEEAAGVSRYRERRRETEGRLMDAREHLSRVEDIQLELGQRIQTLTEQAELAGRYHRLVAQRSERQALLLALRRHESWVSLVRQQRQRDSLLVQREALLAQAAAARQAVEATRGEWEAAQQQVHQAQGALFECNTRVARQEAEDQSFRQSVQRATAALSDTLQQADSIRAGIEANQGRQAELEQARESLATELSAAAEMVGVISDSLAPLESASEEAGLALAEARAVLSAAQAEERGLAARAADLQLQHRRVQDRVHSIEQSMRDLERLDPDALRSVLTQQAEAQALARQTSQALLELQASVDQAEQMLRVSRLNEARARREADRLRAEAGAQRVILGRLESPGAMGPWLERKGLEGRAPIWSSLQVEPGWQLAVGAVLADRLAARGLDALGAAEALAEDLPPANQWFFSGIAQAVFAGGTGLGTKISGPPEVVPLVQSWLAHAQPAETLSEALAQRDQLAEGHCWVTREGHLVGSHSVRLHGQSPHDGSSLLVQRDLVLALEKRSEDAGRDAHDSSARLAAAEQQAEGLGRDLVARREADARARGRAHELELAAVRLQEKAERLGQRAQALETSRATAFEELQALADRLGQVQTAHAAAQSALGPVRSAQEVAQREVQEAQLAWSAARQSHSQSQELHRRHELDERALREQAARLGAERLSLQLQLADTERRAREAQAELAQAQAQLGMGQSLLQTLLQERLACESELSRVRQRSGEVGQALREQDESRLRLEREAMPLADLAAQAEAAIAGSRATIEQIDQQVEDLGLRIAHVSDGWPPHDMPAQQPKPSTVSAEVSRLTRELEALGPVNLAALQELEQARERQGFLGAQAADLLAAVQTLEDAIRKIDRESRALLQSTYDTVNANFSRLFPSLFGGGEARLVLTGDEILDAGVQVMAQPPGKKNSSIQQLSGGEKALTATALVFALFQLNPAPFCLLDEVDAPLDDPNTERLCRLVREMSAATQFLFITHNKISMEFAEHLIGVTMQEQGVSRLVAVDLENQVAA